MKKNNSTELQKTALPACQSAAPCYVVNAASNWLRNNATMYKGNNAPDCIINAYRAGAMQIISGVKFDLLPACTDALEAISGCLNDNGERCAPNMADFVAVANALTIIDDFYQMMNLNTNE